MNKTARRLAAELYKAPQRLDLLHALRSELRAQNKLSELTSVLTWWANVAPDDASAAFALIEAAKITMTFDPHHPQVLGLLMTALRKDPSQETAVHLIREHLLEANDAQELEQVLEDWALAVRRDAYPQALAALSSFMLAHVRLENLGDLDGAIDALEDTLRAFPEHQHAKRMLAAQLEKRARSTASHDDASTRTDEHRAAQLYFEMGTFESGDQGLDDLEKALDLVPSHAGALELLLRRLGRNRIEVQITRLAAYVASAPDRVRTHERRFELVRLLLKKQRHADAVPHLRLLAGRGHEEAKTLLQRICPDASPVKASRPVSVPPRPMSESGPRARVRPLRGNNAENDNERFASDPPVEEEARPTAVYDESVRKLVLAERTGHATFQTIDDEPPTERDFVVDRAPVEAEQSGMRRASGINSRVSPQMERTPKSR